MERPIIIFPESEEFLTDKCALLKNVKDIYIFKEIKSENFVPLIFRVAQNINGNFQY